MWEKGAVQRGKKKKLSNPTVEKPVSANLIRIVGLSTIVCWCQWFNQANGMNCCNWIQQGDFASPIHLENTKQAWRNSMNKRLCSSLAHKWRLEQKPELEVKRLCGVTVAIRHAERSPPPFCKKSREREAAASYRPYQVNTEQLCRHMVSLWKAALVFWCRTELLHIAVWL